MRSRLNALKIRSDATNQFFEFKEEKLARGRSCGLAEQCPAMSKTFDDYVIGHT